MKCPYCGGKMVDPPVTEYMTLKQGAVYDAILRAGRVGIQTNELMDVFFPKKSPNTLRSCIYYINQAIAPMKIKGRGKSYFLLGS
jgi:hypothetical protein